MKGILISYLACLCFFVSCKKVEKIVETVPDNKAIQIETLINDHADESSITFSGRLLYLNDETILDHGFVLEYEYRNNVEKKEIRYSLGNKAITGKINHTIKFPAEIENATLIKYYYYIKTNKDLYKGESTSVAFNWYNIEFNNDFIASPNDKITVIGDFKKIKDKYTLHANYDSKEEIPFTVGNDLKTLIYTVPTDQTHGNKMNPILLNKSHATGVYGSATLPSVKIVGKLEEPTDYSYMYSEKITLKGLGLNGTLKEPFYILFGNNALPYQPEMDLSTLTYKQPAKSYKLGYFNGKDSVFFKQKITIKQPLANALQFYVAEVHPGSSGTFIGLDFSQFGQYDLTTYSVGNKPAYVRSNWTGIHEFNIDNLPEGEYTLSAASPFFTFTSQAKIKVNKLRPTAIAQNRGYYDHLVKINGNFRAGIPYLVKLGNYDAGISSQSFRDGQIDVLIPPIPPGTYPVSVGYRGKDDQEYISKTNFNVEVLAPEFTDFYPRKGKAGDQITLVGKGIYYGMIYFGGRLVWRESGYDEIKFTIPRDIQFKGKIEINLLFGDNWVKGKETFELI